MRKSKETVRPNASEQAQLNNGRSAANSSSSREPAEGLASDIESLNKSQQLASRLRERILDLARKAGRKGLTINEAERQIGDHKGHSVSPRFSELLKRATLV